MKDANGRHFDVDHARRSLFVSQTFPQRLGRPARPSIRFMHTFLPLYAIFYRHVGAVKPVRVALLSCLVCLLEFLTTINNDPPSSTLPPRIQPR